MSGSGDEVRIPVSVGSEEREVWVRGPDLDTGAAPDAAALLGYLLAEHTGGPLLAAEAFSQTLYGRLPELSEIRLSWWPFLVEPEVLGQSRQDREAPAGLGRAAFFSCGLDSFYTAIVERDRLDALVFVAGIDVGLRQRDRLGLVTSRAREASEELGLELVEIETNLRAVTEPHAHWDRCSEMALAAIGLLLGARFREVLFASTTPDRLAVGRRTDVVAVANDRVRVLRHGGAAGRVDKARALAGHRSVQRHLRVCPASYRGAYNCALCWKCTRTMVNLVLSGTLEEVETLPDEVDLARVARLPSVNDGDLAFLTESHEAACAQGDDDLTRALETALRRPRWRQQLWRRRSDAMRSARELGSLVRHRRRPRPRWDEP